MTNYFISISELIEKIEDLEDLIEDINLDISQFNSDKLKLIKLIQDQAYALDSLYQSLRDLTFKGAKQRDFAKKLFENVEKFLT